MTILAKLLTENSRPAPTKRARPTTYNSVAEAVVTLRQYQDVPLHFRKQWITAFLAIMVLLSIIAGLYLNVASRTAITGREIQSLQRLITTNQGTNADLQTDIAILLSSESLEARAVAEGYVPLERDDLNYMVVNGYFPPQGVTLVTPVAKTEDLVLSPEFSESLITWLNHQLEAASLPLPQE